MAELALEQRGLGRQLRRGKQLDGEDIVEPPRQVARRRRERVGLAGGEVEPAADVPAEQVEDDENRHHQSHPYPEPACRAGGTRKLPPEQRAIGQRQEDSREREEVHRIPQVDDAARDALEVRQHAEPRRDGAEGGGKPDQQRVEPDQDQHEHHRDRRDERGDLASRETGGPHADRREPGHEERGAGVLGRDRAPGQVGPELERDHERQREHE